jgi:hypothetical protein
MSTTSEKLRGLVETLYISTQQGKVDWNLSGNKNDAWSNVGGFRVEIGEDSADSFETDIRITVYNDAGDQIDTFSDSYFRGQSPSRINLNNYFAVMSTLLEMAKRQASGADAAIDSILQSLGGKPVLDNPETGGFDADLDDDVPF